MALLAACYRRCLELARAHAIASIAFPAISCGAYGYPLALAVPIAVATTRAHALANGVDRIVFATSGGPMQDAYEALSSTSNTSRR